MLSSPSDGPNRRLILGALAVLPTLPGLLGATTAQAQTAAPLVSCNDGPARQAILDFVHATTDRASPSFVPPEDRIATFDQDGTLWVEHPMYTQVVYCLERVPAVVEKKPELKNAEPFRTVLSGNREAMAKLTMPDLVKILAATLTGMTVEEFNADVKKWFETARHPRWKRPYTELVYQPMLEVLRYLRDNGYKTYIVTGGGQDFVRVYAEQVYGIPPEQVVGTMGETKIPGCGKGVYAIGYGCSFGQHFLHATHRDHVIGRFNAHQAETCLIFVDEALYAQIAADAQILKTMT